MNKIMLVVKVLHSESEGSRFKPQYQNVKKKVNYVNKEYSRPRKY